MGTPEDQARQKIEHEARVQQAGEPAAPPVESVQAENVPTHKLVGVRCGACQANFEFPVQANTLSFGFDCTNCGAHNEVNLEGQ